MSTSFRPEKINYQKYIRKIFAYYFWQICALGSKAPTLNIKPNFFNFKARTRHTPVTCFDYYKKRRDNKCPAFLYFFKLV